MSVPDMSHASPQAAQLAAAQPYDFEEGGIDSPEKFAEGIEDPEERARIIKLVELRRRGAFCRNRGDDKNIIQDYAKNHMLDEHTAELLFHQAVHDEEFRPSLEEKTKEELAETMDVRLSEVEREESRMKHYANVMRWKGAGHAVMEENRLIGFWEEWQWAAQTKWVSLYRTDTMAYMHSDSKAFIHQKWERPFFSIGFVIAQIVFFIVYASLEGVDVEYATPAVGPEGFFMQIVDVGSCEVTCVDGENNYEISSYTDQRAQVWRYLTYSICHIGYGHLAGNAIVEIVLGVPLDYVHGSLRLAAVGILSIIGGALTIPFSDPYLAVVGSSGYGYGLIGVHFGHLVLHWKDHNKCKVIRHLQDRYFRLILLALCVLVLNASTIIGVISGSGDDGVSHAAHVGGFLMGFFFSTPILKEFGRHHYQHILVPAFTVVGCVYLVFGVIWTATQWRPVSLFDGWDEIYDPVDDWCSAGGEVGDKYSDTC